MHRNIEDIICELLLRIFCCLQCFDTVGWVTEGGIQPLITSASKLLGLVLNVMSPPILPVDRHCARYKFLYCIVSGHGTAKEPCGYKVMACPVSMPVMSSSKQGLGLEDEK